MLVQFYPSSYRELYGQDMIYMLEDMLQDTPQVFARLTLLARAVIDLPVGIITQNRMVFVEAYASDMPEYVKRNSGLSIFLLAPLVLVLTLNEMMPGSLPRSPDWTNILRLFVAGLPMIAFVLCVGTWIGWCCTSRRGSKMVSLKGLKHNLPTTTLAVVGIALVTYMLGHDMIGCAQGNSVRTIQKLNAAMQCMQQK